MCEIELKVPECNAAAELEQSVSSHDERHGEISTNAGVQEVGAERAGQSRALTPTAPLHTLVQTEIFSFGVCDVYEETQRCLRCQQCLYFLSVLSDVLQKTDAPHASALG